MRNYGMAALYMWPGHRSRLWPLRHAPLQAAWWQRNQKTRITRPCAISYPAVPYRAGAAPNAAEEHDE